MTQSISAFMTEDHRSCDEEFAQMEISVSQDKWDEAQNKFDTFTQNLEHHFNMEEAVMFPRFETKTGMMGGPTAMMRMEHEQMRNVLGQMKDDLKVKDKKHFFGLSESLMMLMQQHNMKEEQMLYAMVDVHLGEESEVIINEMQGLLTT
ncbi:hemerythrin HHE cation-binding protein [Arcobacter sp. 31_11_sub10_T18]|nr:hemerythrin HHE cation-binding protein [Arcobacter sp. 31_11_sub10_T18]